MNFKPHFKRKRRIFREYSQLAPFPPCANGYRFQGVFTGLSVEVVDTPQQQIKTLHDNGCFGKGSMSRGGPISGEANETLLLGLEEACLLSYFLDILEIKDTLGAAVNWEAFLQAALEYDKQFVDKLAAYLYLKSKNWIIKSGIKFGGDFLIYKQGPRQYHASFLVLVQKPAKDGQAYYLAKNLKGVQRVAETSDKDVLILVVHQPSGFDQTHITPLTLQALSIDETVIRRFNYTSFVQSKQKQL